MSPGTKFVVMVMAAWFVACIAMVALIALLYAVMGWGIFA